MFVSDFINWCNYSNNGVSNGFILYLVVSYSAMTIATVCARLRSLHKIELYRERTGDNSLDDNFWMGAIFFWLFSPIFAVVLVPYVLISVLTSLVLLLKKN